MANSNVVEASKGYINKLYLETNYTLEGLRFNILLGAQGFSRVSSSRHYKITSLPKLPARTLCANFHL